MHHNLSTVAEASEDALPPHSIEAEQGVLGCIFLSAVETLPECIKSLRGGRTCFYDLRHQVIYELVVEMYDKKEAIDVITVQQRLKDKHQLEAVGGVAYLASLPDFVPSAANLSFYVNIVREKYTQRRTLQTCSEVAGAIMDHPDLAGSIIAGWKRTAEYLATELDCDDDRGRKLLAERRFDYDRKPPEAEPIYTLSGVVISTPGNIATTNAQAKGGKSALYAAAIAAAITENPGDIDTLSFEARNERKLALVHFDTEQAPQDHWKLVATALRRARAKDAPPWLASYSLAGTSARDAWSAVKLGIEVNAQKCGGVRSVLIDGYADLVRDVNDPEECNEFVAELHALAIKYYCAILGVLHFNPGTEKGRGHLGSQLERKSETNLTLRKDGDVTVVYSTKQRRAPIPEATGPRFKWSDEHGMHMSCSDNPSQSARVEKLRFERDRLFTDRPAMSYSDLCAVTVKTLKVADRTAERKISAYRHHGLITESVAGLLIPKDQP